MKRIGLALLLMLLLASLFGCIGGGSTPINDVTADEWKTIAGNQVSKLISGFDNEDEEAMGEVLASEIVFVTSSTGPNPEPVSKNLVLLTFEIIFDEPGDSIRNVLKGPMDIQKNGDIVTVTLNIEYVSNSYQAQTWIFKLAENNGKWLIYYWEVKS